MDDHKDGWSTSHERLRKFVKLGKKIALGDKQHPPAYHGNGPAVHKNAQVGYALSIPGSFPDVMRKKP